MILSKKKFFFCSSQENNEKRKFDSNLFSNKKFRHSNEHKSIENLSKSNSLSPINSIISSNENFKCEKNLLDEELNRQKAKLITIEEQRHKQQSLPIKLRTNSNERLQKQSITTMIKSLYY